MRTEKELDFLEQQIPKMAENALESAYYNALNNGHSVLQSIQGQLIEVFPDGTQKFIKMLAPDVIVDRSQKLKMRLKQ